MGPYGWEPFQIEVPISNATVFYGPIPPSLRTPSVNPRPQESPVSDDEFRPDVRHDAPRHDVRDAVGWFGWARSKPLGLLHFAGAGTPPGIAGTP